MSDSDSFSDTSTSSRRHQRHRNHDSERSLEHHHSTRALHREHKDRDTFLGAGAGALVGDVIFPGLGTAAGILLGGIGGRKYAKRSKSEDARGSHKHRDAYLEGREEGREHRGMVREAYREGRRERGAKKKKMEEDGWSSEEEGHGRHGHVHGRRRGEQGWDEGGATFKSGMAVR
jgi:hypothetical protein